MVHEQQSLQPKGLTLVTVAAYKSWSLRTVITTSKIVSTAYYSGRRPTPYTARPCGPAVIIAKIMKSICVCVCVCVCILKFILF